MTTTSVPSSDMTPREMADILRQIRDAVQANQRKRWVEITCAVVLALATMGSAWCAYQSTLWGGVQTFRLAAVNKAGREGSEAASAALQYRAFDAAMFMEYIKAKHTGDADTETFLHARFRPEMKAAMDAWLRTDPFNNPAAPPVPFKMAEYVQAEQQEAQRQNELAATLYASAHQANEASDRYVLLTVMFAAVLFVGGIGGTLQSQRLRRILFVLALVLFAGTAVALGTMPICRE